MTNRAFIIVLVALMLMGSVQAMASDSKNYPGSMCVLKEAYMGEDYWISTDIGRANGTFYNESDEVDRGAVCPMVADEITYQSVTVIVNNPSEATFECRLFSMDVTNYGNFWYDIQTITASGVQSISFDVSDDTAYDKPLHFILCFVPPGGKIIRYYTYEDGGEIQ